MDNNNLEDHTDAQPATGILSRLPDIPGKLERHPTRALLTL
jgi:hypothetical protein